MKPFSDTFDPESLELETEEIESGEALIEAVVRRGRAGGAAVRSVEGESVSVAELFDALAGHLGTGIQRHFEASFDVVAAPGDPVHQSLEPGDLILTRALGEGGTAQASAIIRVDDSPHGGNTATIDTVVTPLRREKHGIRGVPRPVSPERRMVTLDLRLLPNDQLILRVRNGGSAESVETVDSIEATKANDFVRWVQRSLNQILGLTLVVDGIAGKQTREAIKAFQSRNNLVPDGVVGTKTEAAIKAALAGAPVAGGAAQTAAAAGPCPPPPPLPATCQGLGAKETINCFDFGSAKVLPRHQPQIVNIARCILESSKTSTPITTLELVGHTDPVGSDVDNDKLGLKRAESVKAELMATLNRMTGGRAPKVTITTGTRGERDLLPGDPSLTRRVEVLSPVAFKPGKPKAKAQCLDTPVATSDPRAFAVASAGIKSYDGGTVSLLGKTLRVRGNVAYPAESEGPATPFSSRVAQDGPTPIVFMAHGNHATFSDPANRTIESCHNPGGFVPIPNHEGYIYFQQLLARMGIVAVSVDCNDTNCQGLEKKNIELRAGLIIASMRHFLSLNSGGDATFGNRIDFSRVGLFGHSRGAEAVLVVPEKLVAPGAAITGVTIRGVISLAPTDSQASAGRPTGFAFMTILPAGDGDVVDNDGAKFYDQATAVPFKAQLYIHRTNHNFFNRQWLDDDKHGPPVMSRRDHEELLESYGSAFFRTTLLSHALERIVAGQERPPGVSTGDVQVSGELSGPVTVDDHENRNISLNALNEPTQQSGGITVAEFDFSQKGPGQFNSSFFGNTVGMAGRSNSSVGLFRSQLGAPIDLSNREIWIRAAEVYGGSSIPGSPAGFELGVEDTAGGRTFVFSRNLPRPYERRADDIAALGRDATKTMLKTVRFASSCFENGRTPIDLKHVQAILIRLNHPTLRDLAFDQLQVI